MPLVARIILKKIISDALKRYLPSTLTIPLVISHCSTICETFFFLIQEFFHVSFSWKGFFFFLLRWSLKLNFFLQTWSRFVRNALKMTVTSNPKRYCYTLPTFSYITKLLVSQQKKKLSNKAFYGRGNISWELYERMNAGEGKNLNLSSIRLFFSLALSWIFGSTARAPAAAEKGLRIKRINSWRRKKFNSFG